MTVSAPVQSRRGILQVVTFASVSSQFAAGLVWSGLPHYAATATGQYGLYGLLFFISSISGIIAPLAGGYIPSRISSVLVAICASSGTALCYAIIANVDFASAPLAIALVLLCASTLAATSAPAFSDLLGRIQKSAYQGDLEAGSGHYQTFVMLAKMFGFALGPLAFAQFGTGLLYVIVAGYLLESLLLWSLNGVDAERDGKTGAALPGPRIWLARRRELGIALLNGLLSFPLISLALMLLASRLGADTLTVAAFWLATSAVSVAVNAVIARGVIKRIGRQRLVTLATLAVAAAAVGIALAPNATVLIVLFCLFTMGNPIMGAVSRNVFFHAVAAEDRRRFFGALQTATAIGVSAGVGALGLAVGLLDGPGLLVALAALGALLALRLALVLAAVRDFEITESQAKG